jgi:hypothetical protein
MPTITIFFTSGHGSFLVPQNYTEFVSFEAIGSGGNGYWGGGGGGAYAISTNVTGLSTGSTIYYNVGSPGSQGVNIKGGSSWFNIASNTAPTSSTYGVLAVGGSSPKNTTIVSNAGVGSSCVPSGYSGGNGGVSLASGQTINTGAGGGGAAGPLGPGGNGGNGYYINIQTNKIYPSSGSKAYTQNIFAGGGGGGANGGFDGSTASSAIGGNGGASGMSGSTGGVGGTPTVPPTLGTNGGGGAGCAGTDSFFNAPTSPNYRTTLTSNNQGANGSMTPIWVGSVYPDISGRGSFLGPGGGGGAGIINGIGFAGGNGGGYGAGGAGTQTTQSGLGSGGLLVFTYVSYTIDVGPGILIGEGVLFN